MTRSFDVFFDLRLNKGLSKQSWGWWFETPSGSLWRHCNDIGAIWGLPQCHWTIKNHGEFGNESLAPTFYIRWLEVPKCNVWLDIMSLLFPIGIEWRVWHYLLHIYLLHEWILRVKYFLYCACVYRSFFINFTYIFYSIISITTKKYIFTYSDFIWQESSPVRSPNVIHYITEITSLWYS